MSAAAASAYASQYPPSVAFDAAYSNFFERFYATSDTPDAHETYVNFFTEDATLIMASSKAVGRQGSSSYGLLFPSRPRSLFALAPSSPPKL